MTTANEHTAILERCARECTERGWRLAWSLLRNEQDAADVVQQAFLVAVRKPGKIPRDDPWPWVASAIALEARNLIRLKGRRRTVTHDFGEPSMPIEDRADGDPVVQALTREQSERLFNALDELPEDEREAICLVTGSGLSYSAAARALHLPVTTLRLRVQRAVEALRKKLGGTEAGIIGSLPLLPVPEPPPALHASLQAQVSGGVVPGAITIGSIAVKKAYLLWIAAFLLLGAGVAVSYDYLAGAPSGPMPRGNESHAGARAGVHPELARKPEAATDASSGKTEPGTGHPVVDAATGDSSLERSGDTDSPAGTEAAANESERGGSEKPGPEPTFKQVTGAVEDRRVLATIGRASAWTAIERPTGMVVHPDDSCLFTVSKSYVSRWDARTGAPQWVLDFGQTWLTAIALSPDGATLAVGSNSRWIVLLDAASGARRNALQIDGGTGTLAYAPDGNSIAVAFRSSVDVVGAQSGKVIRSFQFDLPGPDSPGLTADFHSHIRAVRFSRDGSTLVAARQRKQFRSCITRGVVRAWQVASGHKSAEMELDSLGIVACGVATFSGDGTYALVPAFEAEGLVLSLEEYEIEFPTPLDIEMGDSEEVQRTKLNRAHEEDRRRYSEYRKQVNGEPNSRTARRFVAVVNLSTGKLEQRLDLGDGPGVNVELVVDDKDSVLAAWRGGLISIYNFALWTPLSRTTAPTSTNVMAFDSGARVLFVNHDTRIARFQPSDGAAIDAIEAEGLKPDSNWINMSGDGSAVLFMQHGELVSWDVSTRAVRWRRAGVKAVHDGACDPDGAIVVAVDAATNEPLLLDAQTGETRRRLAWPAGMKTDDKLTVGRNGTIAGQSSPEDIGSKFDQEFVVWRPAGDYAAKRIPAPAEPFGLMLAMAVSDDGATVAAATFNGYMIADVESGAAREVEMDKRFSNNVETRITPDGKYLLAVALGYSHQVTRIDIESGKAVDGIKVPGPEDEKLRFASFLVAPDGKSIVLAPYPRDNESPTLVRQNLTTGQIVDRYPGHVNTVVTLSQSADGRIVASLCADRVIRVWRMHD